MTQQMTPTTPAQIPAPITVSAEEMQQWMAANGPLHCPHCGHRATVELLDTTTRPREVLTCPKCG